MPNIGKYDRGNYAEDLTLAPHSAPAWEQPLNPVSIGGKSYKPMAGDGALRLPLFL